MKKNREPGKKECLFDSDTKWKRVFPFHTQIKDPASGTLALGRFLVDAF